MNQELKKYSDGVFTPRRKETVTQWAERELVIATGPYAGSAFRIRNSPYLQFILERIKDPKTRKVSMKFATQIGKSLTLLIMISWVVANDPTTVLYIADIEKNAKSVSKNQFQPLLQTSKELNSLLPTERVDEKIQNLEMAFSNSALLYFVGAQSTSGLSGKSIKYLFADEIRAYKDSNTNDESDSLSLALNRTKSFPQNKVVLASSPTVTGTGISKHHASGTCHQYHIPCPHCNTKQPLDFKNLKWDEEAKDERGKWDKNKVKKTVYYKCNSCNESISEAQKTKMLRNGEWVQTNFDALEGDYSFQLSSLYSVNISWSDIAIKWLESQDSISSLKDFKQNYLGEDWVEKLQKLDGGDGFVKLQKDYDRGTNPIEGESKVLMGVDCQASTLKWVVRAFNDDESYLIDFGECVDWDTIREMEGQYNVENVIVDTGHRTMEAYTEIYKTDYRWFGAKGRASTQMNKPYSKHLLDPFTGTSKAGRYKIVLVNVNDGMWKEELMDCLQGNKNWFIFDNPDFKYTEELGNEFPIEIENAKTGKTTVGWKKTGDNDWFDCEKYLLCLRALLKGKPAPKRNVSGDVIVEPKRIPLSQSRSLGGSRL